jgi:hypothetical protein
MLKRELKVDAELVEGRLGEFTIWVDNKMVGKKGWVRFPSEERVLSEVRQALAE